MAILNVGNYSGTNGYIYENMCASRKKSDINQSAEYSKYLQKKFGFMNTGTTSMQGIPTTVSVSGAFLKECMNNPQKAKYLEENLAAIPDCVKSLANYTKMMPGNPVCTYATYIIGDDGNITCMSGCTNDPDGKIARENAQRKAKEEKEAKEKLEKKRAEERAEKRAEKCVEERAASQMEIFLSMSKVRCENIIKGWSGQ